MIRLEVEDYCHDCETFEPHVEKAILYDGANEWHQTTVTCESGKACGRMMEYLKRQAKKEND